MLIFGFDKMVRYIFIHILKWIIFIFFVTRNLDFISLLLSEQGLIKQYNSRCTWLNLTNIPTFQYIFLHTSMF